MKKAINNFINSIDTKIFDRLRSSQGDGECRRYLKELLHYQYPDNKNDKNWDDIMLTLLDSGDLDIAGKLNVQSQEYKDDLLNTVNKLNIRDLQEFVFGYICGSKI